MTTPKLSKSMCEKIDKWLLRYPPEQKRSGVLYALHLAQEEHGFLSTELMDEVAAYLNLSNIAVYEVATFYSMYYLKPMGKHVIDVCTNISCMLNGSDKIVAQFEKRLGIHFNETTLDQQFSLKEVECLGACVNAPVCQIGKQYYEDLTPEKVDALLAQLQSEDHSHG